MKQTLFALTCVLFVAFPSLAQEPSPQQISFGGMYIAKTGGVAAANIEIFTYLKFYDDGSVYLQSVSSFDPESVAKWFKRDKTFSQKGTYKIKGNEITIQVNNKGTEDAKLEGFVESKYRGIIKSDMEMCLFRDKESEESCFKFSKVPE